ncbi:MAG: SRPBCC domain-containing protein [Hyphomicrobiales bacterium]|nr:SRPBCC domain-containing protein [Hyphomicrobiales bacterium]
MTSKAIVALRVKASQERAFDVFVRQIGLWWRPNGLFRFTSGPPGRMAFEPWLDGRLTETDTEGRAFEIGRITTFAPGERLAFTWRQASFAPDQMTEVDVRFEAVGDETRVTVTHSGWDRLPIDHAARHGFPETAFLMRLAEWHRVLLASFGRTLGSG